MSVPVNPLARPYLDRLAGLVEPDGYLREEEVEARAQLLLNEFLKFHFSGQPFQTASAAGGTEAKAFDECGLLFDRASPPQPQLLPLIHVLLADRREIRKSQTSARVEISEERWTWNVLVRTAAQSPVTPGAAADLADHATAEAERANRRVAGQLHWLLRSSEMQALALKGLGSVEVGSAPRIIPSGAWCIRQLVFSGRVFLRIPLNLPG
jgi:hypothetical protein